MEWERAQEKEAKERAAREEAEREAMLSVDWHDFVVVETIEFYDDEAAELPLPMTLKDVSGAGSGAGGRGDGLRVGGYGTCRQCAQQKGSWGRRAGPLAATERMKAGSACFEVCPGGLPNHLLQLS
jgi:hypothetical protein